MRRMGSDRLFSGVDEFAAALRKLREQRYDKKEEVKKSLGRRKALSEDQRTKVLKKTGKRRHICGGKIKKGGGWQADHVFPYGTGGEHVVDNYLPAHFVCNNYRWDYVDEEFQWILKLGVFIRTQIENKTCIGRLTGEKFVDHEHARDDRRRRGGRSPFSVG